MRQFSVLSLLPYANAHFMVTGPVRLPNATMRGTTTRTLGGEGGVPSVSITYDRLGNIVKMSASAPEMTAKK